ncbi:MAG TPA: septum formation initiator family protein [Candidatus Mcinerneyibacterium sp.]|nr:septum formation initiator family protein [Candidatus Mcinerneyibacterium sp.]
MKTKLIALILIIFNIICLIWIIQSSSVISDYWKVKNYKIKMIKQKRELMEKNSYLKEKLKLAKNYDYLKERIARFKLGLKRRNEKIIKLEKFIDKSKKDYKMINR